MKKKKWYVHREYTSCCTLNQMVASDNAPFSALKRFVDDAKYESQFDFSMIRQGGAKALFCMTVYPFEPRLEENLKKLGFEMVKDGLNRREGYDPDGKVRMWILNW